MFNSKYFHWDEMVDSPMATRLGIDNNPKDQRVIDNLRRTMILMDEVREILGVAVFVTSGFRAPKLNEALNGAKGSAHMDGRACDFVVREKKPWLIAKTLAEQENLAFDQLILEYGRWVHVSIPKEGETPRRELLTASSLGYTKGIEW